MKHFRNPSNDQSIDSLMTLHKLKGASRKNNETAPLMWLLRVSTQSSQSSDLPPTPAISHHQSRSISSTECRKRLIDNALTELGLLAEEGIEVAIGQEMIP